MAITGIGLRDAIRAAREGIDALPDEPTAEQVAEYADALELAVWSALVDYFVANVEVVGNVTSGIVVEDALDNVIGETRTGTNKLNGSIE